MKKAIILWMIIVAAGLSARGFTHTYEGQTVTYSIVDRDAKTCQVKEGNEGVGPAVGNNIRGDLVIPETTVYNGEEYTVVGIGEYAFLNCAGLTSVKIPSTVTAVGTDAFSGCYGLEAVEYASIEALCGIDFGNAAANPLDVVGTLVVDGEEVTELVIPESVTSIGNNTFRMCCDLTSVKIPGSVTSIGEDAFYSCSGLELAEFDSIESLCRIRFANAAANPLNRAHHLYIAGKEVFDITIPSTIEAVTENQFIGCTALTDISLPPTIKYIGEGAFRDCISLTGIKIPQSVSEIGANALNGCRSLQSIVIPEGVVTVGDNAFKGCTSMVTASIASTVESIASNAFYFCNSLNRVAMPSQLTYDFGSADVLLYDKDVAHCDESGLIYTNDLRQLLFVPGNLSGHFDVPESIAVIGERALRGCSGLTSVSIPESVHTVGPSAFDGCNSLTRADFASVEALCGTNFVNSTSNPLHKAKHLYVGGVEVTAVIIGSTVPSINNYAFIGCNMIRSVRIESGASSIGNSAFEGCSGLKDIFIPNSVNMIGEYAFYYCYGITNLILPNSVTSIGNRAFRYCYGITSVSIPGAVKYIGNGAFGECSGITTVAYATDSPCTAPSTIFGSDTYRNATLYVPDTTLDTFKATSPWNQFLSITAEPILSDIDTIYRDMDSGIDYSQPYDVYNLQGIRVGGATGQLAPGVYIVRQGAKTAKIAK